MIHRTVEREDNRCPRSPRRTAHEVRTRLAIIQTAAQKILAGDYDSRPISPRQRARYGPTVPMHVALRTEIGYRRTFELGQRLKMGLGRGGEFECWVERRREMRLRNRRRWTRH